MTSQRATLLIGVVFQLLAWVPTTVRSAAVCEYYEFYAAETGSCQPCGLSQFFNATSAVCQFCSQPGLVYNPYVALCEPCPDGQWLVAGVCQPCPIGTVYVSVEPEMTLTIDVTDDVSSNDAVSVGGTCNPCEDGEQYDTTTGLCDSCLNGRFLNSATGECQPCTYPWWPVVTSSVQTNCIRCECGQFMGKTSGQCESCPPGLYYDPSTRQCDSSPENLFYNAQKGACQACPYVDPNTGLCQSCGDNGCQFFNSTTATCESCQEGQYYNMEFGSCTACSYPGFYNTENCQCIFCSIGQYYDHVTNACQWCPDGQEYSASTKICQSCAYPQFYDPYIRRCVTCGIGQFFSNFTGVCQSCDPWTVYNVQSGTCVTSQNVSTNLTNDSPKPTIPTGASSIISSLDYSQFRSATEASSTIAAFANHSTLTGQTELPSSTSYPDFPPTSVNGSYPNESVEAGLTTTTLTTVERDLKLPTSLSDGIASSTLSSTNTIQPNATNTLTERFSLPAVTQSEMTSYSTQPTTTLPKFNFSDHFSSLDKSVVSSTVVMESTSSATTSSSPAIVSSAVPTSVLPIPTSNTLPGFSPKLVSSTVLSSASQASTESNPIQSRTPLFSFATPAVGQTSVRTSFPSSALLSSSESSLPGIVTAPLDSTLVTVISASTLPDRSSNSNQFEASSAMQLTEVVTPFSTTSSALRFDESSPLSTVLASKNSAPLDMSSSSPSVADSSSKPFLDQSVEPSVSTSSTISAISSTTTHTAASSPPTEGSEIPLTPESTFLIPESTSFTQGTTPLPQDPLPLTPASTPFTTESTVIISSRSTTASTTSTVTTFVGNTTETVTDVAANNVSQTWTTPSSSTTTATKASTTTTTSSPSIKACFPGDSTVLLEDGTLLPLANLKLNDRVLTIDVATKRPFFDDVIGFLHYSQHGEMEVVRLHTDDGKTVTLSPKHLIYTYDDNNAEINQPKFASDVKPGDFLIGVEGFSDEIQLLNSTALRVTELSTGISNSGIYAPLTKSGNIVVDSAVASCYAQVRSHRIAHWAMGPLRVVHSLSTLLARTFECESSLDRLILDSYNKLGILNYAYLLETLVPDFLFSNNLL